MELHTYSPVEENMEARGDNERNKILDFNLKNIIKIWIAYVVFNSTQLPMLIPNSKIILWCLHGWLHLLFTFTWEILFYLVSCGLETKRETEKIIGNI